MNTISELEVSTSMLRDNSHRTESFMAQINSKLNEYAQNSLEELNPHETDENSLMTDSNGSILEDGLLTNQGGDTIRTMDNDPQYNQIHVARLPTENNIFDQRFDTSMATNTIEHKKSTNFDKDKMRLKVELINSNIRKSTGQQQVLTAREHSLHQNSLSLSDLPMTSSNLFSSQYDATKSQAIAGAMKALQLRVQDLQTEKMQLQQEIDNYSQRQGKDKNKLHESLIKQKDMFVSIESDLKHQIEQYKVSLNDSKTRQDALQRMSEKVNKENNSLRKTVSMLETKTQELEHKLQQTTQVGKQNLTKEKVKEKKWKKKFKNLEKQNYQLQQEAHSQIQNLYDHKLEQDRVIQALQKELKMSSETNSMLNQEYMVCKDEQNQSQAKLQNELSILRGKMHKGQKQVEVKESENSQLKQELCAFQQELITIKQTLRDMSTQQQSQQQQYSSAKKSSVSVPYTAENSEKKEYSVQPSARGRHSSGRQSLIPDSTKKQSSMVKSNQVYRKEQNKENLNSRSYIVNTRQELANLQKQESGAKARNSNQKKYQTNKLSSIIIEESDSFLVNEMARVTHNSTNIDEDIQKFHKKYESLMKDLRNNQ